MGPQGMIPGNSLSIVPTPSTFSGARGLPVTKTVDYEDGGVAIQDPTQGLLVKRWRARLVGPDVIVDAADVEPFVLITGAGITEISLTFDQNMRPALAFVQDGVAKLRWFDSVPGEVVTTSYAGIRTPRITLDDKRYTQTGSSDVILAYIRVSDGALCFRMQRERFETERVLDAGPHKGLIKIGFSRQLQLQFMLEV